MTGGMIQVVYSGAVSTASEYFADLGYRPSGPSVNIADYMLDTVIQAPPEEATRMVIEFKGCVDQYKRPSFLCSMSKSRGLIALALRIHMRGLVL